MLIITIQLIQCEIFLLIETTNVIKSVKLTSTLLMSIIQRPVFIRACLLFHRDLIIFVQTSIAN